MTEFVNFYLIPGIVLGCIYALGAIGLSMTFAILRFANFAHGATLTLGVYFTLSLVHLTGAHPLVVAPVAMALTAAVSLGVDEVFYKPFRRSPTIMLVIASFGMMLMIRSAVQFFWGVQLHAMIPLVLTHWTVGPMRILPKHVMIVVATVVLVTAMHLLLTRTRIGKAMRATSDSAELASLTGIDTEAVVRMTWIVSASLATAAGIFLAIDTQVETMMGFRILLPMFAAAILGGVGRPYGAIAGGLVIGIAEEISAYPWIGTTPLLSPGYKAGVAFAIMVVMLVVRPQGIFKGKVL